MSNQTTLKDLRNATSSLGLVDGAQQLDLLDGLITDQCGQAHHHANHSAQSETRKDRMTNDTSGLHSSISLESKNLQSYLENKLQAQLECSGSTIYKLTWKNKHTPRGWSYCQRVASVPRTKENDSSLLRKAWTTPNTRDWKDTAGQSTTRESGRSRIDQVPREAFQLIGMMSNLPDLGTKNAAQYQLNPRFSLWLMGYPIEWAYCGERVTQSSPK